MMKLSQKVVLIFINSYSKEQKKISKTMTFLNRMKL